MAVLASSSAKIRGEGLAQEQRMACQLPKGMLDVLPGCRPTEHQEVLLLACVFSCDAQSRVTW